jgi:hypothetical protein
LSILYLFSHSRREEGSSVVEVLTSNKNAGHDSTEAKKTAHGADHSTHRAPDKVLHPNNDDQQGVCHRDGDLTSMEADNCGTTNTLVSMDDQGHDKTSHSDQQQTNPIHVRTDGGSDPDTIMTSGTTVR